LSFLGELLQQRKKKMKRRADLICSSVRKKLKRRLYYKTQIQMRTEMKALIVMTLMIILNLNRKKREIKKKRLQLFLESIKVSERQLMMIQCFSKMRSLPLNHFKERSGQIQRSHAVLLSSHKDHIITHAHLSATPLAQKKDLL
jgi:hypothetical protein